MGLQEAYDAADVAAWALSDAVKAADIGELNDHARVLRADIRHLVRTMLDTLDTIDERVEALADQLAEA